MNPEIPDAPRQRKPLDQMTPEELCGEAARLREHIAHSAERLGDIYGTLYTSIRRRTASTDLSSGEVHAYTSVSNAGRRLAGIVLQAVKRTSYVDRLVESAKADAEEADRQKRAKEQEQERRSVAKQAAEQREKSFRERLFGHDSPVTQDDLIELYGED